MLPWLLLCIAITIVSVYAYKAAKRAVTEDVALDTEAVAKLKAREIQLWLADRSEDTLLVADPHFTDALQKWVRGGRRDKAIEASLLQKMRFSRGGHYRRISLLSPRDGSLWLAESDYRDVSGIRARAMESATRGEPLLDDIRSADGRVPALLSVGLLRPLYQEGSYEPLAVLYVAVDLDEILQPLIQAWPSFRKSAETMLVRRDGQDVVFLNTAHQARAEKRRPMTSNFIASHVIREGAGFYEDEDYRGVPCFGYGTPVAGTPWYVVAKIDRVEAYAELDLIAEVCAVMLGALMAISAWWLVRRRQAEEMQQALNRTIRLLSHCNRALAEAKSEQALLDAICRLIVEVGGYRMAWIGFPQQDAAQSVRAVARFGYDAAYLDMIEVSWADNAAGAGPTGRAIRERGTQVNPDFRTNPSMTRWRDAALARGYASSVSLPLIQGKDVLGALTIYSAVPNAFVHGEVALLEDLARDLARGIAAQRLRVAHSVAEAELRLSEERMRGLFGSISDALFVHGMRAGGKPGCFVEVNDVACRRLGYTRDELLHMTRLDIDAPGCPDDIGGILERLLVEGSVIFESVHVAKDGRRIPVEMSSSSFMLRGERMFVSLARDIADRRRFERERIESERQLATLSSHLQSVRENERAIIARELHDELGQVLTALKMDVSWLQSQPPAQAEMSAKLADMAALVDGTLGTVRRIAADLRPTMLDDLGLAAAIEWLVEEFAKRHPRIGCKLVLDLGDREVDDARAIAAYRIVQECLTNVARHAEATKLHVVVGVRGDRLAISVQDNGRGLRGKPTGGFGLLGMRQRAQALGGMFAADSMPGEGLSIDVEIPLAGRVPAEAQA